VATVAEALEYEPSAAVVASPTAHHAQHAVELLDNGCPTLVEKPVTATLAEAQRVLDAAGASATPCAVAYPFRFDPTAIAVQDMICSSVIGGILHAQAESYSYLPSWRPGQDYRETNSAKRALGGGVLTELSHEFDYVTWFLGPISSVYAWIARTSDLEIDVEDTALMTLESRSEVPISINLSFASAHARRVFRAEGTKGSMEWDVMAHTVKIHRHRGLVSEYTFPTHRDQMYVEQMKAFLRGPVNGRLSGTCLEDALHVMRIIEAAWESKSTQAVVTL